MAGGGQPDSVPVRDRGRLGAAAAPSLPRMFRDVHTRRLRGDEQFRGDLPCCCGLSPASGAPPVPGRSARPADWPAARAADPGAVRPADPEPCPPSWPAPGTLVRSRARRARSVRAARSGRAPSRSAASNASRHSSCASSRRPASARASASRHGTWRSRTRIPGRTPPPPPATHQGRCGPGHGHHSASARASQARPSTPSTNFGRRGYAAPPRAISTSSRAAFTMAAAAASSPAALARVAPVGLRAHADRGRRMTGGP